MATEQKWAKKPGNPGNHDSRGCGWPIRANQGQSGTITLVPYNEIRAGLAETLETSRHTSAYQRILRRMRREAETLGMEFGVDQFPADWLCPIDEQSCEVLLGPAGVESVQESTATLNGSADAVSTTSEPSGPVVNRGAIEKRWRHGFLPLTIEEYLSTLDWAARQVIPGKSGAMDASLPPLFERLKLSPTLLMQMVVNFDKWFRTAAGCVQRLMEEATRRVVSGSVESEPCVPPNRSRSFPLCRFFLRLPAFPRRPRSCTR